MRIDFACNDEHGLFMERAERVTIGELDLECFLIGGGVKMKIFPAGQNLFLKVGRVILPFTGHSGGGNWCWEGYEVPGEYAVKLLNYLQRQKYWGCDGGPVEAVDKFESKKPFTLEDLELCL
jgi:hypothetical protein